MLTKSIVVTGGAGFIGSNFIPYFLETHPEYNVINVDKLTYAANIENLREVAGNSRYQFVKGDISDRNLVQKIFEDNCVFGVIHFAAESHVDNSIDNPAIFIETNIKGTFTILDVARQYWMFAPFSFKPGFAECRFLHVSTDEVYGSLGEEGYFTEQTPYAPNSPYSASKASADFIVRSFFHTYGMNVLTTNCSNNYGPKQHYEKLIPTIIRNALAHNPIPIYGDGKNVRDWLYVLDHCKAIDLIFHKGTYGETYNIGSNNEQNNITLATTICELLDELVPLKKSDRIRSYKELITFVKDRPGHDRRYAIDASKLRNTLGWVPEEDFNSGIRKTVEWYIKHFQINRG